MASGAEQLAADFEQVKKMLPLYPDIKIIRTESEPPDQYEIEYHLKGYKKNTDGSVTPDDQHKVLIKLPFGYPHFPPTVKPLTPIFHPDIDPNAIRIADHWQNNKSLSDLILHIGKMICGTFYSPEDPFNQEAFDWYHERSDWLPFDSLETDEGGTGESFTASDEDIPPALSGVEEPGQFSEEEHTESEAIEPEDAGVDLSADVPLDFLDDDIEVSLQSEDEPLDVSVSVDEAEDLTADIPLDLLEEDIDVPSQAQDEPLDESNLSAVTLDDDTFAGLGLDDIIPDAGEIEDESLDASKDKPEDLAADIPLDLLEKDTDVPSPSKDESLNESDQSSVTLDDDTVVAGLGLDETTTADHSEEQEQADISPLQKHLDKNEFFKAKKFLAGIPESAIMPNRAEFAKTISRAIGKAKELFKNAEILEHGGELEKAGLILDQIANVVVDYPGLDRARSRIRDALMDNLCAQEEKTGAASAGVKKKPSMSALAGLPYKQIITVLVLLGLTGGGGLLYLRDKAGLEKADINVHKALEFKAQKRYKVAKKTADTAQLALNQVLILKGGQKKTLEQQIHALLNSEDFKQGLAGRILYHGQYINLELGKQLLRFDELNKKAEQLTGSGKITEAILAYEKTLAYSEQVGLKDKARKIRRTLINLRLEQTLTWAKKAEEGKEWSQAAETYRRALELSSSFSSPEDKKEITKRLAAAAFHNELDQSKTAFTASEWQKTIDMLERGEKILADNPKAASKTEKTELHKLLVNSKLYHILASAKKDYDTGEWTGAINEYNKAIDLLKHNADTIGGEVIRDSISKIEKTILMTEVAREQGLAALTVKKDDLAATLTHYRAIIDLINHSKFGDDPVLKKIMEKSHTQFKATQHEYEINRKIKWLKENYEKIFRENYPSATSSLLDHPQAAFIKKVGNLVIFNLSCVERRQGRSFRLELNYQYDQKTKSWSLYSGE